MADATADQTKNHTSALPENLRRHLPVVGMLAASIAVTELGSSGGVATPATSFASFALLLGGLSIVILGALGVTGHEHEDDDDSLACSEELGVLGVIGQRELY